MAMAGLVAVAELCKGKQLRGAVAVADVISSVISAILSLSLAIYITTLFSAKKTVFKRAKYLNQLRDSWRGRGYIQTLKLFCFLDFSLSST